VAGMGRNQWPDKIGMGGRFASESVAGLVRNIHLMQLGFLFQRELLY